MPALDLLAREVATLSLVDGRPLPRTVNEHEDPDRIVCHLVDDAVGSMWRQLPRARNLTGWPSRGKSVSLATVSLNS